MVTLCRQTSQDLESIFREGSMYGIPTGGTCRLWSSCVWRRPAPRHLHRHLPRAAPLLWRHRPKTTRVGKHVQDLFSGCQALNLAPIVALVEEEPCFLPPDRVGFEPEAVFPEHNLTLQGGTGKDHTFFESEKILRSSCQQPTEAEDDPVCGRKRG